MSLATLSNIEKTFGQRVLFDRLNLNIEQGERIGKQVARYREQRYFQPRYR